MPPTDLLSLPPSLSLYVSLSFPSLLSLWIIITYHTGLIIASKRVSMKTLITLMGGEHSALILSHTGMKRNSWEKQDIKLSSFKLFFNRKFILSLSAINIEQRNSQQVWPIWIDCSWWLFMLFCLCPSETKCFILGCVCSLCFSKRSVLCQSWGILQVSVRRLWKWHFSLARIHSRSC